MRVLKANVIWSFVTVLFLTACQPSEFTDLAFPQPPSTSTSDSLDALIFEPTAYDFGDVRESSGEGTTQISVENDGSAAMYLRDFESSRDDFEITSSTTALTRGSAASIGSCTVNLKLNAGQSCTLDISFVPSRGGDISGNITVTYANALTGGTTDTQSIGLTGTGIELLDFDGLDSIAANDTTVTSTVLRWDIPDGVDVFKVYQIDGGTPTLLTTLGPALSSYSVTGLSAGTTYQYRVNAFDVLGVSDGNTTTRSVTTKTAGSFSVISAFTMAEAATGLSGALSCSDGYGSTPTYTINSETDSDVNCSIVSSGGQKVSCSPDYKTGHSTWTSTVQVNCALNGVNLTRDVIVTVTDTDRSPVSTGIVSPTTFDEDTNTIITLGYSDADGDLATACATSNLGSVSAPVACACAAGTCTVTLKGSPQNYYGAADFDYNVTANSVQSNTSTNVSLTIVNIPEPPEATGVVSPTSFDEDLQQIITLEYTDVDAGIATACSVGNLTNVTVTQACACVSGTCTVGLTGTTNYFGAGASFTYTVTTNSNNMTSDPIDPVSLTINAINDAPTISDQGNTSTDEDEAKAVTFTIGDVDNTELCNSTFMSMTSSDTDLVEDASVVWSGTAPNCTATITPEANANGAVTITFTITDAEPLTASDSFVLTINPINDDPVVAAIADTSTDEDTDKGVSFSVSDIDGDTFICDDDHFSMTSSDTNKVANASVVWSGTSPNCVGTVTPEANANGNVNLTFTLDDQNGGTGSDTFQLTLNAVNDAPTISNIADTDTDEDVDKAVNFTIEDIDGDTLDCNATYLSMGSTDTGIVDSSVVFSGTAPTCTATITPEANANGNTTITLTVDDQNGETAADSFVLTVDPVNDNPTISDISNTSTDEDTDEVINFTISDVDGDTLDCTSTYLAMSSSGTSIIANASVVWSGTAPDCVATISPEANANGAPTITFTLDDELGGSTTDTFVLTVDPVNDAPTISDISNQITGVSEAKEVEFTIDDIDGDALVCNSTYLSYASSNASIVAGTGAVVWGGSYPNCTATITPVTSAEGTTTITITVSDTALTDNDTFTLTPSHVPTVSGVFRTQGRQSGGQILVIHGINFPSSLGSTTVTLTDGVNSEPCTSPAIKTYSQTTDIITCDTGAAAATGLRDVVVDFPEYGTTRTLEDAFTYIADSSGSNVCDQPTASMAAVGFQGGAGTSGNPFIICTNTQWENFRSLTATQSGKYYNLGANLDLNSVAMAPLFLTTVSWFNGNFDGDSHYMINYNVTGTGGYTGIFHGISGGAVRELNLVNISISTSASGSTCSPFGGYTANSTFSDINFYGNYTFSCASGYVGGLTGDTRGGTFKNILIEKFTATSGLTAGGIAATNWLASTTTLTNVTVGVAISGASTAAGIANPVNMVNAHYIMTDVYVSGTISATGSAAGLISATSGSLVVKRVGVNAAITAGNSSAGAGFVGFGGEWASNTSYFEDCFFVGSITSGATTNKAGMFGRPYARSGFAYTTNVRRCFVGATMNSGTKGIKGSQVPVGTTNTYGYDTFWNSEIGASTDSSNSGTTAKTTTQLQEQNLLSTYAASGAAISGTANYTNGQTSLTNLIIPMTPEIGDTITGADIPGSTTITAVTGPNSPYTVTISQAVTNTATGGAVSITPVNAWDISSSAGDVGTANQTSASTSLTNVTLSLVPKIGQRITGTGIPTKTFITAVSGTSSPFTLTISNAATSSVNDNPITVSSRWQFNGASTYPTLR